MQVDQKKLFDRARLFLKAAPFVLLLLIVIRVMAPDPEPDPAPAPGRLSVEDEIREILEARSHEKAARRDEPSPLLPFFHSAGGEEEEASSSPGEEAPSFLQPPQPRHQPAPGWPVWMAPAVNGGAEPSAPATRSAAGVEEDPLDLSSVEESIEIVHEIDARVTRRPVDDSTGVATDTKAATTVSTRIILKGSLIAATLLEPANTDEPGTVSALVSRDVYDSLSGEHLLVPLGSRLIGKVVGLTSSGTAAEVAWERLVLADGTDIDLVASATDRDGGSASGRRKTRTLKKIGAVMSSAVTAAAVQLSQRPASTVDARFFSVGQIAAEEASRDGSRVLDRWADEQLSREPTVFLAIGPILVKVEEDIEIPGNTVSR